VFSNQNPAQVNAHRDDIKIQNKAKADSAGESCRRRTNKVSAVTIHFITIHHITSHHII